MAQKSAVSKYSRLRPSSSRHADAAGQVLNRCSQKSFYLSATGKLVSNVFFYCSKPYLYPLVLSCQIKKQAATTKGHWTTAHLMLVQSWTLNRFMTCIQWHMAGRLHCYREVRDEISTAIKVVNVRGGILKHGGGYFCHLLHQTEYVWWKTPNRDLNVQCAGRVCLKFLSGGCQLRRAS